MTSNGHDYESSVIFEWIPQGSSALDLGCGEGDLIYRLMQEKKCRVQGIEIDEKSVHHCVAKGLSVLQGDIDTGLSDYGDGSFNYVILNESLQQVKKPDIVLQESLRVGRQAIMSFPNFAYCQARFQILFRGRTPVTRSLPYEWHDTPNLHFLSIRDFEDYCRSRQITIIQRAFKGTRNGIWLFPNLLASTGIYRLQRERKD